MPSAMDVHEEVLGTKGSYMLYNVWDAFGDYLDFLLHAPIFSWSREVE
jgi:hypothetical protein